MRQSTPIQLVVYYPTSQDGKSDLAQRVSDVHAQAVFRRIKNLNCPTSQKLELLDAVIETARERSAGQKRPSRSIPGRER